MQFKTFILDKFQEDAIKCIDNGHSVIVSAATGTGKTLIADYMIDKYLNSQYKIVYTAPIKALSNQKYKDFKKAYGEKSVGLLTGDVSINPKGQVVVMTTEIYRNMLMTRDHFVQDVKYVVFDEIHYINDIERGYVWEESIIFSPHWIRFLCLSATIPNAQEFAEWIKSTHQHEVEVVNYQKRAVPLKHFLFDARAGIKTIEELKELSELPEYDAERRKRKGKKVIRLLPNHLDLIRQIGDKLPCIFFVFSRKDCEKKARELAREKTYVSGTKSAEIIGIFNRIVPRGLNHLSSVKQLKAISQKGIAYHHAGLLPVLKEAVEALFEKGLISVLYCTETFAVGVNMPAKSVCFNSLEKYDGLNFRYLNSKEYFQLAGRAGRRGIDTIGYVFAMVEDKADLNKIRDFTSKDIEPIRSQFRLTFNTVINLVNNHTEQEIEVILKSNFDYFLKKQEKAGIRIMSSFNNKIHQLARMGYLDKGNLTEKGQFITHIYDNELLIGELCASKLKNRLTDIELLIVLAAIAYEERRADHFSVRDVKRQYNHLLHILSLNNYVFKQINKRNLLRMIKMVSLWATGSSFDDLLEVSNLLEGDIIRFFRRLIDILRQVRAGMETIDPDFSVKVNELINMIDRDLVRVEF